MAAVVSHYEAIWLCSWSHQRAVSTQTTAALPLSAAVKTARDLLWFGMTPAPPHTPSLMWMQIRLSACGVRVCHSLWLVSGSGAEFRGASDRRHVASLCSVWLQRGAAIWTERSERQGGKNKDETLFLLRFFFPLLGSLLPSASLAPSVPPDTTQYLPRSGI